MKKIFTTVFIVAGMHFATQAQTKGKTEFSIGVGINSAYVTANAQYGSSTDLTWNPNVAVSADHYLSDMFSLKAKIIYDTKGWNGILANGTQTITGVNFKLNYITVPITANVHFGNDKMWYLMGGPYVGFLTSAQDSYYHQDLKSSFNSIDAGVDAGFGVNFSLSNKLKLFFEYDGQVGFANVLAHSSDGGQNIRSSGNVGLRF